MYHNHHTYPFHIGMRNLKTAIAATLCAILYLPFGRNPTFACIGAIFGLGKDMGNSWLNGGNRLFGTILGGVLGASTTAFLYELARTGLQRNAAHLAWEAAKMRFLAVLGKICAGIALAVLLIRQVFF